MINENRVEAAVNFHRDNAERHGQLKGAVSFYEYKFKRAKAAAFLEASGTVAEREAKALLTDAVKDAAQDLRDMIAEETELRDKLKAADLTIEVWRSQNANQRRGNV